MTEKSISLAVVGGDLRQGSLARLLHEDGHHVCVYALERQAFDADIAVIHDARAHFAQVDAVILPMPILADEKHVNAPLSNAVHRIETLLDSIPTQKVVLGGAITQAVYAHAQRRQLRMQDYLQREELAIANATPTAEGALQIAMEELPITLHGARALVIGNGRIGKVLAHKLACLGAQVSISARTLADFAQIKSMGLGCLDTAQLCGKLADFDVVFNTVPVRVLGLAELAQLQEQCLVMDLASKPGGVDFTAASQLGRKAIWALSLPGKVAPITSAKIIQQTIYHMLHEEGIL